MFQSPLSRGTPPDPGRHRGGNPQVFGQRFNPLKVREGLQTGQTPVREQSKIHEGDVPLTKDE